MTPAATIRLRDDRGAVLTFEPARWHGPVSTGERALLASLRSPVLDVGCGPGRIVEAAIRSGVVALGVDPAPAAVALARQRGCPVLQRSVFDALPGEGRWGSVLLWDGNIGIGGDPVQLLRRCGGLVRPAGRIIVELEPPGTRSRRCRARLERGEQASGWFGWSVVGTDAIASFAEDAGLVTDAVSIVGDGRWFASLSRAEGRAQG